MHPVAAPERRRLLDKLIREIARSEAQAVEHAPREAKRVGEVPPVIALREVAHHADSMRTRFETLLHGHDITINRAGLGATLSTLRSLVVDRVVDPERAYRTALLDLRHGIDVVKLLREIVRAEGLFGVIRWCDDWLGARRAQLARVEAQLGWYAEHADVESGIPAAAIEAKSFEAESAQDNVASGVSEIAERPSILDFK